MGISIQFLGAAGTVTGSRYLVDNGKNRVLVDCGLFQGLKELRLQDRAPFPVDPRQIDCVILTHAHLDHTGYLPLLVKNGFNGKIYCTAPTRDIAKIILTDSAHLQEEDAEYANKKGFSKHSPAEPLYTVIDAQNALRKFFPASTGDWINGADGFRFRFTPSGHILGSAFIELEVGGVVIAFSGDLGRSNPILLRPPAAIERADYLLVESTYGDRIHKAIDPLHALGAIVNEAHDRRGVLLIPSFAVGRTQDILYLLATLKRENQIPDIPVFLDSPMGINATEILLDYEQWHNLTPTQVNELAHVATMVKSRQQSKEISNRKDKAIIIAGSGMLTGGRILHHLAERLPDDRNTVLLVGYQAAGTRGRLLKDGIPDVKIHGQYIPVRARVEDLSSLSAHADQAETLSWLRKFKAPPKRTFIIHGEPQSSDALRVRIRDVLGWECSIPKYLERFELT